MTGGSDSGTVRTPPAGGYLGNNENRGVLYGVGVGPGAPDLITLRAARLIGGASVIVYPTLAGAPSFARAIAADLIPAGVIEIVIDLEMTVDRAPAQAAYDRGAAAIAGHLTAGRDVVVLCEGDPLFYGSFMYLHARLAPRFRVEIVPGITSLTAAAARAGRPLAARNAVIEVLPGPLPDDALAARIAAADTVAILKVGRHLPRLRALLDRLGLTGAATYVERATLPGERVCPLAEAPDNAPYFSLILITKGADPWL
jgi:precorrin-2/cobalt-factor-2 C20-methyltransferase